MVLIFAVSLGLGLFLWWPGSLVVRASDLHLNGRGFDPRPLPHRSVGTGIGDRLRAGIIIIIIIRFVKRQNVKRLPWR